MKNNNPYSKYRYDNNLHIKVRSDNESDCVVDVFGTYMRPQSDNVGKGLYDTAAPMYGVTAIANYIYKVQRVNQVDSPIVPTSYKGPTLFKLFKL